MKTLADVSVGKYSISLSKLLGKQVTDIEGTISKEWGDPFFQISRIVLADNSAIWVEGEHDIPYIPNGSGHMPDDEQMNLLYDEENA